MISFLLLNLMLFVGSYLAGCIPVLFNFPAAKLRLLTIFGAGLLLGAALVVIIPEGVHSLYTASSRSHTEHIHDSLTNPDNEKMNVRSRRLAEAKEQQPPLNGVGAAPPIAAAIDPGQSKPRILQDKEHEAATYLPFSLLSIHQHVGIALLLGYLCMLFVDQLGNRLLAAPCCTCLLPGLFSCPRRCCFRTASSGTPAASTSGCSASNGAGAGHQRATATLGLVVHSFADGLALGAAFASEQVRLELVLFLAIILHKIPAAFGLCCYLIHEGFSRDTIRIHLIIFAAASPLAALLTYVCLAWPAVDQVASQAAIKTGFALLLSGGTFLYVAASHILPEIIQAHSAGQEWGSRKQTGVPENSNPSDYTLYTMGSQDPVVGYNKSSSASNCSNVAAPGTSVPRLRLPDLFVLTTGAIVPVFFSLGHSH
ncbi:Zinc transporter ZIP9 [Clonorchis sinensis]|uniref:Zinc transporter ZIP9 n=1 Tax=Clonorchis sinensis TaxID=79923 RepID=A0A419PH74_CLOSI|nr:Zinc transporter ZIP9 [Clonorchis sinensis]